MKLTIGMIIFSLMIVICSIALVTLLMWNIIKLASRRSKTKKEFDRSIIKDL